MLSLAEPFAPTGDQEGSHRRGKGLLGHTSIPAGLHLHLWQCQLPKQDPRAPSLLSTLSKDLGSLVSHRLKKRRMLF